MLKVETTLNVDDWQATMAYVQKKVLDESRSDSFWNAVVSTGIYIAIAVVILFAYDLVFEGPFSWQSAVVGFLFAVIAGSEKIITEQKKLKHLRPIENGFILGQKQIIFDEQGIEVIGEHAQSKLDWRGVIEITETDEHIYLFVDKVDALILPKRQLDDPAGVLDYLKSCQPS